MRPRRLTLRTTTSMARCLASTSELSTQWQKAEPLGDAVADGRRRRRMKGSRGVRTVMERAAWRRPVSGSRRRWRVWTSATCESTVRESGSVNLRHAAAVTRSHGCRVAGAGGRGGEDRKKVEVGKGEVEEERRFL
nr:unnamed protein product [Digitaria exilis]